MDIDRSLSSLSEVEVQGGLTSDSSRLPLLPIRVSQKRLTRDDSNPPFGLFDRRYERSGIRPKPSRSQPNDYVDEPVHQDRSDGKPVLSISSSSEPLSPERTLNSLTPEEEEDDEEQSKSTNIDPSKEKSLHAVSEVPCKETIICPRCKLCRCSKCAQPRHLPGIRCGQTDQCLPQDLVDCFSCICLATAAYRRCSDFSDDELPSSSSYSSSEVMCSCTGPRRSCCKRWTVLTALVPCLPCIVLYWPLRWMLSACSACYNCRRRSCQCSTDSRRVDPQSVGGTPLVTEEPHSSSNSSSSA